ncbi:hypothetical protein K438DRAFT_992528 [Mycena galopus ATCC 62051]|nr:hypothetical protein K438DRAFT_992528 [Mycena galopus ATCC 62051]
MASPFQPYSPHLQMQRPSSDSWGDAPQMHVLPSSEVTCGPGYPDAHFFPSSVSAPTFPPTYPQWTPTDDSMYHSPHTAVVSPPHAAGFGSPSIPPPMQSHDPHHPTYSPLAYALPEWFSSSRHNTVPGISVSSPVPQTDSSGFIYPPPGEYLALSNGDRGSIVSPNSRRKRRNRRRNKDHVASEGPPRGKDNFKRTQPNVKTAKPVKRAIDAKRGLHLGGTGTPGRTGGWNVGTSTAGTTRTGEPPVNVEIRDVSGK